MTTGSHVVVDSMEKGGISADEETPRQLSDASTTMATGSDDDGAVERMMDKEILSGDEESPQQSSDEGTSTTWDWDSDPDNPYNWSTGKKWAQVWMCASFGILA